MTLKLLGTIAKVWFKNVAWEIEELKRQSDTDGRLQAFNCPKLLCLTSGPMMAIPPPHVGILTCTLGQVGLYAL